MVERRGLIAALLASPGSALAAEAAGTGRTIAAGSLDPHDIRGFGARVDGVADDAAAIERAAASGAVLFPAGVTRVGRALQVDAEVWMAPGAVIRADAGATVRFGHAVHAPLARIFAGEGRFEAVGAGQAVGHPEWFGARSGEPASDCAPAINACIESFPVTQLQQSAYHVGSPVRMSRSGRTLRGVNETQDLSVPATLIVIEDATAPGLICGAESATKVATTDQLTLQDFAVVRGRRVRASTADLASAPAGVRLSWCALLRATHITALEHAVGFQIYGCIECYLTHCSAIRREPGEGGPVERVCGFHLDYRAPLGLAGGNASIYLDACRAFTEGRTPFAYSAGMATSGGFVDLFVSRFETGFQLYGVDLQGDGVSSDSYSTQDCHFTDCVLDSNAAAGVRIRAAGRHADVHIRGCYVALDGRFPDAACVRVGGDDAASEAVGGAVSIVDCQFIGDGAGVRATHVGACTLAQNSYLNLRAPIAFTDVAASEIRDVIRMQRRPGSPAPAVSLTNCRSILAVVSVSGVADGFAGGVSVDRTCSRIEVNLTRLEADACGGARRMIVYDGAPWGGTAGFGSRNLATGAP